MKWLDSLWSSSADSDAHLAITNVRWIPVGKSSAIARTRDSEFAPSTFYLTLLPKSTDTSTHTFPTDILERSESRTYCRTYASLVACPISTAYKKPTTHFFIRPYNCGCKNGSMMELLSKRGVVVMAVLFSGTPTGLPICSHFI